MLGFQGVIIFLFIYLFFKYCADVENCGANKGFGFIYIYIYIYIYIEIKIVEVECLNAHLGGGEGVGPLNYLKAT